MHQARNFNCGALDAKDGDGSSRIVRRKSNSRRIRRLLDAVDWSFKSRTKPPLIESMHPYPAKFIGDLPRALLETLPVPSGTAVLDPFCGSGTTLTEAQTLGHESIGIDLNPIACLISRVRTSASPRDIPQTAAAISHRARSRQAPPSTNIPNIDHWFQREIQEAISQLLATIEELTSPEESDIFRLALSSILVRVSNQESDTRYAAVVKAVFKEDVFRNFVIASRRIAAALASRTWPLTKATVLQKNTLEVVETDFTRPVGLVITSPPYPNAYEYWLYHKYRMWWLGFDPLSVKHDEIGARAHFFGGRKHTAETFVGQMQGTLRLLSMAVVPGGYACFVIGRSKIHGVEIDNGNIIHEEAEKVGFSLIGRYERPIAAGSKSFNLSHANIRTESVLVLHRSSR